MRRGRPGPEIVAHAREQTYDAILVGARGVGRVAAIIGSVSAYVLTTRTSPSSSRTQPSDGSRDHSAASVRIPCLRWIERITPSRV